MNFWKLLWRAIRLRCPLCGESRLFATYFKMHDQCDTCGVTYEREAGFFLGSIYFNYGLTSLVVAIAYPVLLFTKTISQEWLMPAALAFILLFPVWFFRYSRSLWMGFDQFWDPRPAPTIDPEEESCTTPHE